MTGLLGLSGGTARRLHVRFLLLVQPEFRYVRHFQRPSLLLVRRNSRC